MQQQTSSPVATAAPARLSDSLQALDRPTLVLPLIALAALVIDMALVPITPVGLALIVLAALPWIVRLLRPQRLADAPAVTAPRAVESGAEKVPAMAPPARPAPVAKPTQPAPQSVRVARPPAPGDLVRRPAEAAGRDGVNAPPQPQRPRTTPPISPLER